MTKRRLISTLPACRGMLLSVVLLVWPASSRADNTMLPDGKLFQSWEVPTQFSHTYHVAQQVKTAADSNPGTVSRPWKTIGRAAAMLQPGDVVVIHAGIYREWVKPARGGTGPGTMIAYEAAQGEKVVLKGSDLWKPVWEPSRDFFSATVPTYQTKLSGNMFKGANPFCLQNFSIQTDVKSWQMFPGFELRRGQLFLDGQPLTQVSDFETLVKTEDAFWVEENGMTIHVRIAAGAKPDGKTFEITTREQVFAPVERALNYIRVSGLHIFHSGNGIPIPPPQRGALSATAGHHWIIEDCEVGYANSIGIDLGGQYWNMRGGKVQGFHIVRRNYVHQCGVGGIEAWHNLPNQNLLVEDNLITDCGSLPITHHYETGGIKMHCTVNSLFRRNVFLRNRNSAALWLDGEITNTRITQNVFSNTSDSPFGSIFTEISQGPNLVDNNIIINSRTNGIYEHDAGRVIAIQNLIANGTGSALCLNLGGPDRKMDGRHPENDHRIYGNIFAGFDGYILVPNSTAKSDCNVLGGAKTGTPFKVCGRPATNLVWWRVQGNDTRSVEIPLEVSFDEANLELRVKAAQGTQLPSFNPITEVMALPPVDELWPAFRKAQMALPLNGTVPSSSALMQADLLGNARDPNRLQVGPLVGLQLDGTPMKVDPRHLRPMLK